jgi:hypothetical protein
METEAKVKEESKLIHAIRERPSGEHWKASQKYLYEASQKKEAELTIEERRSLLLLPPVEVPDQVRQFLDAEAIWHRRRVEYLGKFRLMKTIKEEVEKKEKSDKAESKAENNKKEDEPMKDDKYVSLRMKRKRVHQKSSKDEPKPKRVRVSAPEEEEVSEEQWGRFTDELETRYKMNPILIDEMGERIDRLLVPKVSWSLKRTHTDAYEEQIKAETAKKIQEWKDKMAQEKDEKELEATLTELKHEKKKLREVVVMQAKVMAMLKEEVVKWLSQQEEKEFELEDGKLLLAKEQQPTKLTRQMIKQVTIDSVATKGNFTNARNVVQLVKKLLSS